MIATFRYIGSVTGSVTLCSLPMAANSVTPRLWQSRHQSYIDRHRNPQRLKALHFAIFTDCVTTSETLNVTP